MECEYCAVIRRGPTMRSPLFWVWFMASPFAHVSRHDADLALFIALTGHGFHSRSSKGVRNVTAATPLDCSPSGHFCMGCLHLGQCLESLSLILGWRWDLCLSVWAGLDSGRNAVPGSVRVVVGRRLQLYRTLDECE